jgi:membrane-associated PAP2 superfamily phosphatase
MSRSAQVSALAYCMALAVLAAAVLLRWLLDPLLGDTLPLTTLFAAVGFAVWVGGYRTAPTASIGGLKQVTQVHCPWDLEGFGGHIAYEPLFAARSPEIEVGKCFPAAHSGSGFALFAFYFAIRNYSRRWSTRALYLAIAAGTVFAFGQEARGAHFPSHDLWSAMIAWCVCLILYVTVSSSRSLAERSSGVPTVPVLSHALKKPALSPLARATPSD